MTTTEKLERLAALRRITENGNADSYQLCSARVEAARLRDMDCTDTLAEADYMATDLNHILATITE